MGILNCTLSVEMKRKNDKATINARFIRLHRLLSFALTKIRVWYMLLCTNITLYNRSCKKRVSGVLMWTPFWCSTTDRSKKSVDKMRSYFSGTKTKIILLFWLPFRLKRYTKKKLNNLGFSIGQILMICIVLLCHLKMLTLSDKKYTLK